MLRFTAYSQKKCVAKSNPEGELLDVFGFPWAQSTFEDLVLRMSIVVGPSSLMAASGAGQTSTGRPRWPSSIGANRFRQ